MTFRKSSSHGGGCYTSGFRPRKLTFKKVVKEVMRDRSNNRFMEKMEKMLRRIVREEFDRLIQPYLPSSSERSCFETPQSSRPQLKLRFINSPRPCIFTGSKIEAEDGSPVAIELVNAATNARVVSGPLSSSRVEIVPLKADFTDEKWTVEEFKRNILTQRQGKRPLLTGELTVTLKKGVGEIHVAFSDNSSWTRSRKFRVGATLAGGGAVEARSEAFGCKDQRGESYRKHHPPYPGDEVWRLEKIAKDGVSATRLNEHGIRTVKDFRRSLSLDRDALYSILNGDGPGGISKRLWETIVSHAMDCVLDEAECYLYNSTANDVSLLFNSVYELMKVSFKGGPFQNADHLTNFIPHQLKLEAYQNRHRFVPLNGRTFEDHPQRSLHFPQDQSFGIPCPGLQHIDFQGISGSLDSSMARYFTATAAPPAVQPEMLVSFDNLPAGAFIDNKILSSFRNSFRVNERDPLHDESQTVAKRDWNKNEEEENTLCHHHHYDAHSNCSPGTAHWSQEMLESMLVSVSGTEEDGMYDVRIANIVGSPRARWCKVKAAFKLREVWRHTTARNRGRGKACTKPRPR